MNPMYIDSYARISHTRHWLSSSPKKHRTKNPSIIVTNKRKSRQIEKKFNANTLDTFCFHWPDMHSYVLVRVLEATIAILPVRSRVAFLYFNHAPLPTHPSPRALRKALQPVANASRIQDMFKNWKHTLTFEDDISEDEEEEEEDRIPTSPIKMVDTPPSTPKTYANVTLSDVLSNEPNLHTGWIHAPCAVKDNQDRYDNHLIIAAKHTELKLTARCFTEKMMFMNLVRLKHGHLIQQENKEGSITTKYENSDTEEEEEILKTRRLSTSMVHISSEDVIQNLQKETAHQLETIYDLVEKVKRAKQAISSYSLQLFDLDQSLDRLMDNTLNIQFSISKKELDLVNHQLADSITEFHADRQRIIHLQERVFVHSAFLIGARQKYDQIKKRVQNHAWYPWFYTALAGLVLLVSIAVAYYYYDHSKRIEL